MKTSIFSFVLAALLPGGNPARAQDSDQETKKKIMQTLEKGVDALLKFKRGSERAFQEWSKAIEEKLKRRERPKPPMPGPPQPLPPREEPLKVEQRFVYDPWAAWNSFDKGAWVEQETTTKFGDMPESKGTMKTTITEKNDREIKADRSMWGMDMKDQVVARKPQGIAPEARCAHCNAVHKSDSKNISEEIQVAGKKLKCDVVESTNYDCKGEKQVTIKNWYSKEIPGWIAKSESESFGQTKGAVKSIVTGFGTR